MKTRVLLSLALLALGAGCVDNRASVEPLGVCGFSDDPAECTSECDVFLTGRTLSFATVGGFNEMSLFLQYQNQLENNQDLSVGRPNTNDAYLRSVEVTIETDGLAIPDIEVPVVEVLIPAGGTASALLPVIPLEASIQLEDQMLLAGLDQIIAVLEVRAKGIYQHGPSWETGDVRIPVLVSRGSFLYPACNTGDIRVFCPNSDQTGSTACVSP